MTMIPETLLLGAIASLAGVVAVLWRQLLAERHKGDAERHHSSRLIFALLAELARARRTPLPTTQSTPEKPQYIEATALAEKALNGDIDDLLRDYLEGPPTKPERKNA